MTEAEVIDIIQALAGVETLTHAGGVFFFYGAEYLDYQLAICMACWRSICQEVICSNNSMRFLGSS